MGSWTRPLLEVDPTHAPGPRLTCHIPEPQPSPATPWVCTTWQVKEERVGRTCFFQGGPRFGLTSGAEHSTLVVHGVLGPPGQE